VEALRTGLVERLLVADVPVDERLAWFGPNPIELSLDESDMAAMGIRQPGRARLEDVAVRAAVGGGAQVDVVPASVVDGTMGAVLRAAAVPTTRR
jgi:hypothetical protein